MRLLKHEQVVSLACVNFHAAWGNKKANLEKMKAVAMQASRQGNNIIAFPELALSGYECDEDITTPKQSCTMHRELAETIPGPSTKEMADLAQELGVYIIFGMPEQDKNDPDARYISSAIVGPEGILGAYRKLHLAPPPRYTETSCFTGGDRIPIWETRFGPIGVVICYDFYYFPEVTRIMALKGARLIINTTASVAGPGKPYFIVQQTGSRATENLVYAASVNLVGTERTKTYYGHSVIAGPVTPRPAHIFIEAGEGEEIISATLDFQRLAFSRESMDWQKSRQTEIINREFNNLAH